MPGNDHIGQALARRGLRKYILSAPLANVADKPEVKMALVDALAAWIIQEKDRPHE